MTTAARRGGSEKGTSLWTNVAVLSVVAVVGVSVVYILSFPTKWRSVALSPNELDGRVVVVAQVLPGNAPARDFYRLPCTRWIALRRLFAQYTKNPKTVGEIYTLADGGGWMVAKEWHEAAVSLASAQKSDPKSGTDVSPFVVADPSSWPPVAHFQSSDSGSIVVSQFHVSGTPKQATLVRIEKRVCE